jgi:hypothetical protein
MLADLIGLAVRFPDAVARYWQRLSAQPGFANALERQRAAALEQGVSVIRFPARGFGWSDLVESGFEID